MMQFVENFKVDASLFLSFSSFKINKKTHDQFFPIKEIISLTA